MKQLIELSQEYLIECDNPKCGYKIHNESGDPYEDTSFFINMPCPLCGENLLTEKDHKDGEKFLKAIKFLNKWFSWLTIFWSFRKTETSSVKIHNGETKIKQNI